jgi:hypothetical protein
MFLEEAFDAIAARLEASLISLRQLLQQTGVMKSSIHAATILLRLKPRIFTFVLKLQRRALRRGKGFVIGIVLQCVM